MEKKAWVGSHKKLPQPHPVSPLRPWDAIFQPDDPAVNGCHFEVTPDAAVYLIKLPKGLHMMGGKFCENDRHIRVSADCNLMGGLKGVKKNYLLVDKEWKQASGDDRYRQDERAKWTARKTGNKFTYSKPSCFPGGTSSCSVQSHLLLLSVGLTSAFSHDHTSLEHHHHWITEEKLTYPSIPVTGPQVWKHHCSIRVISNPLNRSQSAPPRASVSPMKLGTIQPKTSASPSSQTQLLSLNRLGQVK